MSTQLEIIDAKDRFAELLDRARSGEEIVLADAGKPVAKLGPAEKNTSEDLVKDDNPRLRVHGMFEGRGVGCQTILPDPLNSDEELKEWGL